MLGDEFVLEHEPLGPKCPNCGSTKTVCDMMLTTNPPIPQYKCKDCGRTFTGDPFKKKGTEKEDENNNFSKPAETTPVHYGWICPRCGKVNAPFVVKCDCKPPEKSNYKQYTVEWPFKPTITVPNTLPSFSAEACQNCANNPANGGSGMCNCILGNWNKATCSVDSVPAITETINVAHT